MTPRLKLVLLFLVFLAPFAGAAIAVKFFPEMFPGGKLNHGTLISPARALPALALRGVDGQAAALPARWSLVYLAPRQCDDACAQAVLTSWQVWHALSKDRARVQRVYLAPDATALAGARKTMNEQNWDLLLLADAGAPGQRASDFFKPEDPNALYLVDPNGNWVMAFSGIGEKDLYRDLKKILRFSQVG